MANFLEPVNPSFPEVYEISIDDDVIAGEGEEAVANRQARQLVERTAFNKKANEATQEQVDANRADIDIHTTSINSMKGRGGYLTAFDFGKSNLTQKELNDYALTQIHSKDPNDIWNGTHVKNLFDSHVWALTNTPETDPPIHEWCDDGFDAIKTADQNVLGVVMGSTDEGSVSVDPLTGKMSIILPTGLVAANSLPLISKYRPYAIASGKKQITIRRGTYIPLTVDGVERWYKADADVVLNVETLLGSSLLPGKDYTIFLVPQGDGLKIRIDTADVPQGFNSNQVLAIIGFHTLCVSVGTGLDYMFGGISQDHPLNGYNAGDILPQSVWCLNHRPHSSPKGMVYIPTLDFWCDIYLQSGTGVNTKSVYQGAITRSRQYVDFVEDQFCVNKSLLNDEEFAAAMLGSNERTAVLGANETGATSGGAGGRKDTANRRMISIYGVEEGCGSLWQWLATTSAAGSGSWNTQNGGKGDYYGGCYALLAGGGWTHGASCGSRCRAAADSRSDSNTAIGGRGRSRPMRLYG